MKAILRAACLAGALGGVLWAQAPGTPESLSAWPYFKEIQQDHPRPGLVDFALDREVLDKASTDQSDLRLYDGAGREIPYALRVRREIDTHSLFTSREFNRAVEGGASLVSCDLGEQPQEHNEVVISTAGDNFRRLASIEGSPDGAQWSTLASDAILFRFTADGRTAERQSVSYPVSRYRYVRVRVQRDPQVDRAAPEIASLGVRRSIRVKGQTESFAGVMDSREAEPVDGRPASIWRIDLGGRVPIQSLILNVGEPTFSRPFQLEIVDDPSAPVALASGDLTRREEAVTAPVEIDFGEQFARRLKLTVTDDRNPPLSLGGVSALSAMRQVVFQPAPGAPGAVRLYYGNPKGIAPNYDVAARIPAEGKGAWASVTLGPERANPIYHPEPKPLSERAPWLVYIVLIGACAALAAILVNLAKAAARSAAA
jgi:hypothetical protein